MDSLLILLLILILHLHWHPLPSPVTFQMRWGIIFELPGLENPFGPKTPIPQQKNRHPSPSTVRIYLIDTTLSVVCFR